jgi:hypothetical protein
MWFCDYNIYMTTMGKETSLNELRISNEEFETLTKCQPEVRYQYTLKRIADTETMWSIVGGKNSFAIQSFGKERLLPIWSSKEYAQAFCMKENADCESIAITLDSFEESVIDYICKEELLLNVFPTIQEPVGKIVGLNTFAEDLSKILEDYK